jgi:ABC-2 type transport system permease protein
VAQTRAELRSSFRVPEYVVGVVAVPIILYAMFGLPNAGTMLPGGTDLGALIFASMAAYGIVSLAIFTFGVDVAEERGKGWLRRMRATPMPFWAYFVAKVCGALVFGCLILAGMLAVALFVGRVQFDTAGLLGLLGILLCGVVAFSTMGFAMAYWFRPKAAAAIGNLIFLPLAFLSGFFFPLAQLPAVFQNIAPYLPTHHFGQLVWAQTAPEADVAAFGSLPTGSTWEHVAWVVGGFVVFGVLAVAGYRRDLSRSAH